MDDKQKVESINDDVFATVEQSDDGMLLVGGSWEAGAEYNPAGGDAHGDWTG